MLLIKQTNGSFIHDGMKSAEFSWADGGERWLFLKLSLQTPSFEPQHKVLLKSDQMVNCKDKASPLKLLFLHLWEWGPFNVTFIYIGSPQLTHYIPSPQSLCKTIALHVMMITEKKRQSFKTQKVWSHTQPEVIQSTYDNFCQEYSLFYCRLVSSAFDFFIPKNSDIFIGIKAKIILYL